MLVHKSKCQYIIAKCQYIIARCQYFIVKCEYNKANVSTIKQMLVHNSNCQYIIAKHQYVVVKCEYNKANVSTQQQLLVHNSKMLVSNSKMLVHQQTISAYALPMLSPMQAFTLQTQVGGQHLPHHQLHVQPLLLFNIYVCCSRSV